MGLDMYLKCNGRNLTRKLDAKGMVGSNECTEFYGKDYGNAGIGDWSRKSGTIAYWRKANQIH